MYCAVHGADARNARDLLFECSGIEGAVEGNFAAATAAARFANRLRALAGHADARQIRVRQSFGAWEQARRPRHRRCQTRRPRVPPWSTRPSR